MATVPLRGGRSLFIYAIVFLGYFYVAPAMAGDANQLTLSISGRDEQYNIVGSYLFSFAGDTAKEGVLVRAAIGGADDGDDSASTSAEFLLGYQHVAGEWRLRALAGIAYIGLDDVDRYGVKLQLQAYTRKSADIYVNTTLSYNSARQDASGLVQVGGQIGNDLVLGPEIGLTVADTHTRGRLGLFLAGLKLGEVGVSLRGGYTVNETTTDTEGTYYYGASANYRF